MHELASKKSTLATGLNSHALRADAIESLSCLYLAVVVLGALLVQFLLERAMNVPGWWVAPVASLGIVWLLFREAREAWEGDDESLP